MCEIEQITEVTKYFMCVQQRLPFFCICSTYRCVVLKHAINPNSYRNFKSMWELHVAHSTLNKLNSQPSDLIHFRDRLIMEFYILIYTLLNLFRRRGTIWWWLCEPRPISAAKYNYCRKAVILWIMDIFWTIFFGKKQILSDFITKLNCNNFC